MRRVLKWDVRVDDQAHPIGGGPVVLVACQRQPDVVQVWTLEDPEPAPPRMARVYGTGHHVPPNTWHLGSAVTGVLVWHLFGDRP